MRILHSYMLAFFMLLSFEVFSQTSDVSGYVLDANTAEPIVFALVSLEGTKRSTYTDEEGFFFMKLPVEDQVAIRVSYLGYDDTTILVSLAGIQDGPVKIRLSNNLYLPTIDVKASAIQKGISSSIIVPDVKELKRMPALFGETDLLKSLTLLPGVSTGLEGTSNIQIRGGNPSQTNTLLDGISLYNTGHFGGFLSSVDPYGVKGITVYKGGIPAKFGGRLSGVLDIDIRDGRKDKNSSEISVGTATFRAGREGFFDDKTKYLASARFSYPSLLVNAFKVGSFERGVSGNKTVASMYDGIFKVNREVHKGKLSGLFFISGDFGTLQEVSGNTLFLDEYRWQTLAVAATYDRRLAGDVNWKSKAYFSRYGYGYGSDVLNVRENPPFSTNKLAQQSILEDLNFSTEIKWYASEVFQLSGGVNIINHVFRNFAEESRNEAPLVEILNDKQGAIEYGFFGQADYRSPDNRINIMGGVRLSSLAFPGSALNFEPRLRVSLGLFKFINANFGYDVNTQFVHQLATSNSIFPNDVWILADEVFVPSRSNQVYLGLASSLLDGDLTVSIEAFRKSLDNLLTLRDRSTDLFSLPGDWRETIATGGEGEVEGLEFYLKKSGKKFNGWVAYTLSSSQRKYAEINEGRWFPYTYDRTHDIAITGSLQLTDQWVVSSSFIYQTGYAVTFPIAASADYFIYGDVNNARVPAYHRLDLSASRTFRGKKKRKALKTITLGVYNLYNRQNPIDFRVEPTSNVSINPSTGQQVLTDGFQVRQRSLFPIIPSISYKWELD